VLHDTYQASTCVAAPYDRRVATISGASQDVRFCRAPDGVRIAYAVHGSGPPLVVTTCWLSHLQHDWQSPVWRHFLRDLGQVATIIRYDERGHGLSDRDVDDFSLESRIGDLEAVVEHSGVDRFAVLAMSQGGPVAIRYVEQHLDRVTRVIFYGSYAAALPSPSDEDLEMEEAIDRIIKVGWSRPTPEFRRVFTTMMIPGATEEQMTWLDELQRVAVTADTMFEARRQRVLADATDDLARLTVPTLILHSVGDRMNDFERSRVLASGIPDARLVPLESSNHIVLEDEPAWRVFVDEVTAFLRADAAYALTEPLATQLSPRELEVLRLAADGLDNEAIAEALTLSVRTVERHLQNVYAKLDLNGRNARTAAVARLLAELPASGPVRTHA
jgi:pimeloyl-ACP methyl ester carboxylesterase/DNA-binding CsgD family transcriptional regulator